jgi:hypothetical protein
MSKCPICNSKKGRRSCLIVDTHICSLCCGETRVPELCSECQYYQKPKRKYNEVPAYSTSEMDGNRELESYGYSIEGALCAYDIDKENILKDSDAIKIIELLIDIHYFNDQIIEADNQLIINGVNYVNAAIEKDLQNVDSEVIVKTLGVIRFVAKRRTNTGKEYMNIIHQFVGTRVDTGIRIIGQ